FQAEDGIRDDLVTGVQTCALPISIVPDVAQLVSACDLILFTTVASTPHITDATLFEHNPVVLHISLRDLAPEILLRSQNVVDDEIGRASCRERVESAVGGGVMVEK